MKRFLFAFFAVLTAFCLLVPVMQAADGAFVTVSASKSTVQVGEDVQFTVNLKNAGRISSVAFLVKYDSEVFSLAGSEMPKKTKDYFYDSDGDGRSDGVSYLFVPLDEHGTCGLLLMPREKSASREWFMSSADDLDVLTFRLKAKKTAAASSVSVSVISLVSANEDTSQNADIPVPPIPDTVISAVCEHRFGAWEKGDGERHKQVCTVCGENVFEVHQWNGGEQTQAPTCKEPGIKTYTCTVCTDTKTETIGQTELHTWDSGKIAIAPTCKDEGVKLYTCSVCENTKTEILEKAPHAWDDGKITKDATCKDEGEKSHLCTVCGETKTEPIARTEVHTWDGGRIVKQPTCSANGAAVYTCAVCNKNKTESLAATGDCDYSLFYQYDAANHWYECIVCHDKRNVQAHTWDAGILLESPTHTASGKHSHTCTACGMTAVETLPVLAEHTYTAWEMQDDLMHAHACECGDIQYEAHRFEVWTVVKEAEDGEAGIEKSVCEDCGFVFERLIEGIHEGSSAEWQSSGLTSPQQQTETTAASGTEPYGSSLSPAIPIVIIAAVLLAAGVVIAVVAIQKKKTP